MRKKLTFLSILLMSIFLVLTACNGANNGENNEPDNNEVDNNENANNEGTEGTTNEVTLDFALWDSNQEPGLKQIDRKSTRLNSSHVAISYAVLCLKIN